MAEDQNSRPSLPSHGTLASRLEYLFDKIRPSHEEIGDHGEPGRKFTNKEIADRVNALAPETGVTITPAYIGELRRGISTDPRTSHIRALARAFGVNSGYFVDDASAQRVQDQIALLGELRRMDVKQVALRHLLRDTGLSESSADLVEQMVAKLVEVDRLTTGDERAGRPTRGPQA